MTHKAENLIGRVFDKCKLVAKLGAGGMGSVYLAEHSGLNRKVALKILPADMSRDPEYVARFRREALTAARLEHPNIVQVYDVGQFEGRPYIIMQYVDGESLSTVVENLGAMDPKDAAKVIAGMLRGLQHAHEQGIVHRDVKPDNVLVTKGDQPKLLDFGLATESEGSMQITKDGMVVGTPYYLSPEQARGKKATPLSDIYAAGVTLYYLLCGTRPFTGATALAVLNKHIHEQPEPPSKKNPKVPKTLNDIVLKLLAKAPEDRYPSAAAAAQAIEDWLAGREVRVALPWRSRLPVLSRKQKLLAAAGGGAALALLLLFAGVALFGGSAPPPPPPPPEAPKVVVVPAPSDPARDKDLVDALTLSRARRDDYSAWGQVLAAFDTLLGLAKSKEILEEAKRSRDAFVEHVRSRAEAELKEARRERPQLLDQLRALDAFPKPMLALDVLGDLRQIVRDERERLLERLDLKFLEDEAELDRLLAKDDFDGSTALLSRMLRTAEILPYARERRLARLHKVRDVELPKRERDAADRLVQAWLPVNAALEKDLAARTTAKAWGQAVKFLKEHKEARLEGLAYDPLLSLQPDSVPDRQLDNARFSIGTVWAKAEDTLPYRILTAMQDTLDIEWLLRQVGNGVRKSVGGRELRLETFRSSGRIRLGPKGLEFALKAGAAQAFAAAKLHPADLILLAAAADDQTPEQALEVALLARAAGVAWLSSGLTERWFRAETLFAKAGGGPEFRRERLREIGRAQAREALAGLLKDAERRKYEDLRKSLEELAAAWAHDPDVTAEIARAGALLAAAELRRAGSDWARIKTLAKQAFRDEEHYKQHGPFSRIAQAVWNTGQWLSVTQDSALSAWTWEGRAAKSYPPAALEPDTMNGLLLQPNHVLWLDPAKTKGLSGFNAQFRVPLGRAFEVSVLFDAGGDGRRKRLTLRDPDQVTLWEGDAKQETPLRTQALEAPLSAGRWFDLGWAADVDSLFIYVDQRPLFALRGGAKPDGRVGLLGTSAVYVRKSQFRR